RRRGGRRAGRVGGPVSVLVLIDHDRGAVSDVARQAVTLGRSVAAAVGVPLRAVVIGPEPVAVDGVESVWHVTHPLLDDYSPGGWEEPVPQLVARESPTAVVRPGTYRANKCRASRSPGLDMRMAPTAPRSKRAAKAGRCSG